MHVQLRFVALEVSPARRCKRPRAVSSTALRGARQGRHGSPTSAQPVPIGVLGTVPSPSGQSIGKTPVSSIASRWRRTLIGALAEDRARWPLWLPVAFGSGIGLYFGLPWEPPLLVVLAPPLVLSALAWRLRLREKALWPVLVLFFATLGTLVAAGRTALVDTVLLDRPLWADIEGIVERSERRPSDVRLTVGGLRISADRPPSSQPDRVRIVVRTSERLPDIGDRIRFRARLSPPPPPSVPGGFDFQRSAFFDGLGAVGFAIGEPEILSAAAEDGLSLGVAALRSTVAQRLSAALPGETGAVAAALIVGERAGLDEATVAAFRDSGLAHLLAISGLHMGLVAGTLFGAIRLALCLVPGIALRWPVKKIAALTALAGSAAYLLLAGAPVPTQRAFLMTGVVLLAILVDREAVTLRLVALAGFSVLILRPDALVGASFQLSFAAVVALVAAYESWRSARIGAGYDGPARWAVSAARYIVGVAATSLIASLATAPFVTYHFQALALGGLAANLFAVPLTAFVTMPAGIAGLLAMPFGLEAWVLPAMGVGIDTTLSVAEHVVAATGPAASVYPLPVAGIVAVALGGCWIVIWRTRLRWVGLLPVIVGVVLWASVSPPDVLVSADGRLSAVAADEDGGWAVSGKRGSRFQRSVWSRRWGVDDAVTLAAWDRDSEAAGHGVALACDDLGCTLRRDGLLLSLVTSHEAALEDCAASDVLIAVVRLRTPCSGPTIVVHRPDLQSDGAHAVWLAPGPLGIAPRMQTVFGERGVRPWVVGTVSR